MSGVRALCATANPELRTTCLILISTSSLFLHKYKDEAQAFRDCFLKTLWDTDATDFTEFHGKNRNKKAPFRGSVREAPCTKKTATTTASFDQSKEEPADGHQSKQTASPGAKEIGHTVAA